MQDSGNYYLINHLVLFTGLTDRTIRNYISSGILRGEKINGTVYDFLLDDHKKEPEICMILDLPGADEKAICEYFCYQISSGSYQNLRFNFDGVGKTSRVILKGRPADILGLVNGFDGLPGTN